ncbi:UNVERIFIED_CONTAM: recombinase family protein [Streptococcus canis]|uniref:Recombinase family protein n=1 Tax=Streptococcus canis TaxID=1329 RepID=A0AAE4TS91_STRCB|nr:recombinase family protein [Streptococcus canis]MDV5977883.1 recombinase family protein [Streptococcus canis]
MVVKLIPLRSPSKKKRVCAYVRVSSDSESQAASLENQRTYFEELYSNDSEFVGIYYDQGISGSKRNRPGFQAMIRDCLAGKIDLIHTKSISRFTRNTELLLETARHLKELNIDIYFEEHKLHTLSSDGEVMLSVLASIAEDELSSMSSNLRWAYQKKFSRGEVLLNTKRFLGYELTDDGELIINPNEAQTIKRIYSMYLSGEGTHRIAKSLNKDGIPTATGARWHSSTITSILKNEKYKGSLILQKTFRDGINGPVRVNKGQFQQYVIEENHPAIISSEDWEKVQNILSSKSSHDKNYQKRYSLSGLLKCCHCGSTLKRQVSYKRKVVWCCSKYIKEGKKSCRGMRVPEVEIKNWVITKPTIVKEEVSKDGQKYYSYSSQDSGNRSGVEATENTSCGILPSVHRTRRTAIKL